MPAPGPTEYGRACEVSSYLSCFHILQWNLMQVELWVTSLKGAQKIGFKFITIHVTFRTNASRRPKRLMGGGVGPNWTDKNLCPKLWAALLVGNGVYQLLCPAFLYPLHTHAKQLLWDVWLQRTTLLGQISCPDVLSSVLSFWYFSPNPILLCKPHDLRPMCVVVLLSDNIFALT